MKKGFVLAMVLVIIALLTGCGQSESVYEKEVNEINLPAVFFKFEDEGEELNHIGEWLDATDNVQFVDLDKSDEIAQVKVALDVFLKEMYGVDVSEKINKMETKFFTSDSSVLGVNGDEENTVYINQIVFEQDRFENIWVHEVLHVLGFMDEGANMATRALYESFNESVTTQAMHWMNKDIVETAYAFSANATTQIIMVDPEFVVNVLTKENYDILGHINNVLKDVEYPLAGLPEETTIAEQYGAYLLNIIDYTDIYMSEYGILIDFVVQEITTAYCREFELSDEMKVELEQYWLMADYNETALRCDGDSYYFEKV